MQFSVTSRSLSSFLFLLVAMISGQQLWGQVIISRSFSLDGEDAESQVDSFELGELDMPLGSIISSAISDSPGSSFFPMGGGLPNDTAQLLRMPQIVSELGLQDDQREAIGALSKAMNQQVSEVIKSIEFGTENSGKIMQEAQRTIRQKTQEKLEEVLTPQQLDRLNEIKVQSAIKSRGAMSLMTGILGEELGLSDKQKSLLKTVNAQKRKEMQEEIARLKEKYFDETVEEVLDEKQLSKLKSLMGDEYEVKTPDFRSMLRRRMGAAKSEPAPKE